MKIYIVVDEKEYGRNAIKGVFSSQVAAYEFLKEEKIDMPIYSFKPRGRQKSQRHKL